MSASQSILSSILCVSTHKIESFPRKSRKLSRFDRSKQPTSIAEKSPSSLGFRRSAPISSSLTLDHGSVDDEELKKAESKIGAKVKVNAPLKVYHVPKLPEFDLTGKVGVLKQYVGVYKGKRISANLPYKVEFEVEGTSGRDGKPVKFSAHLREDEFEFLD